MHVITRHYMHVTACYCMRMHVITCPMQIEVHKPFTVHFLKPKSSNDFFSHVENVLVEWSYLKQKRFELEF